MATLKLRKPAAPAGAPASPKRAPLRGGALRPRPTLAEAQALRTERNAPTREPPQRRRAEPANAHGADPPPVRRARPPAAGASRHSDGSLRLSKRMSELGIASRREADEWIARGWVRVDGLVVSELGSRVLATQRVTIDPRARRAQAEQVTVLLNKPVGFVSGQAEDGHRPARVLVTPDRRWREDRSPIRFTPQHLKSLVPAGRLDIDSVGLLVLTQDGRIARQLIGEDSDVEKEYLVRVASPPGTRLPADKLALLGHGLALEGEALRPARVEWLNDDQLRFVLQEGKKRQIRRMCEAVGLQVLGLKRVRIGAVALGALPAGQWRYLRADEHFVDAVPAPR